MKIEGSCPNPGPAGAEAVEPGSSKSAGRSKASRTVPEDRVELSPDARLLVDAARAAEQAPAIREDLVQRMRQKLASGELGDDALKLADQIIDRLLER